MGLEFRSNENIYKIKKKESKQITFLSFGRKGGT